MEKNKLPDSFCWAPYVNVDLDQDGSFYPCYRSKVRQGTWKTGNLVDEYNNDSMRQLRDDLWNGRENANCVQCHRREAEGVESTRQQYNRYFSEDIAEDLTSIIADPLTADVSKIHTMEIRPHGMCTNACAHCDENSSSRWIKIQGLEDKFQANYIDEPDSLTEFFDTVEHLKTVHFTGGEPLLYENTHLDYLRQLPKNIQLRYHTSLKTMPSVQILSAWQEFSDVRVFVSLDTSEKFFSYFRWGSNWPTVTENILAIQDIVDVRAAITVNCLTMLDFVPLISWLTNNNIPMNVAFVDPPHQLSCVFLPTHLKLFAARSIDQALVKVREYTDTWMTDQALERIEGIRKFMFTHYNEGVWHPETIKLFEALDQVYGLQIRNFTPELHMVRARNDISAL